MIFRVLFFPPHITSIAHRHSVNQHIYLLLSTGDCCLMYLNIICWYSVCTWCSKQIENERNQYRVTFWIIFRDLFEDTFNTLVIFFLYFFSRLFFVCNSYADIKIIHLNFFSLKKCNKNCALHDDCIEIHFVPFDEFYVKLYEFLRKNEILKQTLIENESMRQKAHTNTHTLRTTLFSH